MKIYHDVYSFIFQNNGGGTGKRIEQLGAIYCFASQRVRKKHEGNRPAPVQRLVIVLISRQIEFQKVQYIGIWDLEFVAWNWNFQLRIMPLPFSFALRSLNEKFQPSVGVFFFSHFGLHVKFGILLYRITSLRAVFLCVP